MAACFNSTPRNIVKPDTLENSTIGETEEPFLELLNKTVRPLGGIHSPRAMGRFVTRTKFDFIERELAIIQRNRKRPKNGVNTLLMCLFVGTILQTLPVQAENLARKDIKTVLEIAKVALLKSTYYFKLQPVVDLVQVVKRPFKSSNAVLYINDEELAFAESKMYSIQSLFLLVRYHVEPGEEVSHGLFDITLSKYAFLNTTTFQLGLKPLSNMKKGNAQVQTLVFEGPFTNCNIKLSIKNRPRAQWNTERKYRKREWWVAGDTAPLAISTDEERKYFQIRRLGRIIIDEGNYYP